MFAFNRIRSCTGITVKYYCNFLATDDVHYDYGKEWLEAACFILMPIVS